ncbi:unnamed protein product [Tetraodon nigroviridis]|uniref:(spotted green pufferfish) hypothetical protein n=1 Tax=Tetraodon nigroviridis TaxID=99883 RepID=Q4SDB0_TETNG|nr:unnamed protein product [Tetraodon nigroviridis]
MGGVHLHMVGQAPKVHLVQAVGMLMISSVSQWRDDKRVEALTVTHPAMTVTPA